MSTSLGLVLGTQLPYQYFVTQGYGEGNDAFAETTSFDAALLAAGIDNFNILRYSSVLPAVAEELVGPPSDIRQTHGGALYTIMAMQTGSKGETIMTGLIRSHVYRTLPTGEEVYTGGFVCELEEKNMSMAQGHRKIKGYMHGLLQRRGIVAATPMDFTPRPGYRVEIDPPIIDHRVVTSKYGTSISALAFVNYIQPVLAETVLHMGRGEMIYPAPVGISQRIASPETTYIEE